MGRQRRRAAAGLGGGQLGPRAGRGGAAPPHLALLEVGQQRALQLRQPALRAPQLGEVGAAAAGALPRGAHARAAAPFAGVRGRLGAGAGASTPHVSGLRARSARGVFTDGLQRFASAEEGIWRMLTWRHFLVPFPRPTLPPPAFWQASHPPRRPTARPHPARSPQPPFGAAVSVGRAWGRRRPPGGGWGRWERRHGGGRRAPRPRCCGPPCLPRAPRAPAA